MFVDDSCINSSFFLSILLFSIVPAMFANCPGRRINNVKVTCSHFSRDLFNDSYLFDTAAIVNLDQSGPCEFRNRAHRARLSKVDTDGREIKELFKCTYDNGITNDDPELCCNYGRVKVKYNIEKPGDRDAFNFGLELVNAQPNDTGLYRYEMYFWHLESILRKFTKHFKFSSGEHNVYSYRLFLKDMISGE